MVEGAGRRQLGNSRPATTRQSLNRTSEQRKGMLPRLLVRSVSWSWRNDHALRNAIIDVAFALDLEPGVSDVCQRRVRRGCLQRTQIAADPTTAVELQRCQAADLPIALRRPPRARVSRGCQPLCHA